MHMNMLIHTAHAVWTNVIVHVWSIKIYVSRYIRYISDKIIFIDLISSMYMFRFIYIISPNRIIHMIRIRITYNINRNQIAYTIKFCTYTQWFGSCTQLGPYTQSQLVHALWLFNISMENCPFIDDLAALTQYKCWFPIARFNNQQAIHD